ncbi:M24 family metallopeptidase [Roseibium sp. SCP14]|uniref:M24 family metallopeptidase n=1 Tax=Roseibium sp. SCP14 TaxID=3141375 RepID=UPI00333D9436
MTDKWDFRAFTAEEHEDRLLKARSLLETAGIGACVLTSPELLYYFTGYEAHTHHAIGAQALVLPTDNQDPVLLLRDGDLPQAEETLVVGRVKAFRLGATKLSDLIHDTLAECGTRKSIVGLDLSGPTMNGTLAKALEERLGNCTLVDCWHLLGRLRTILSPREIAYLHEATGYANNGIDAFYRAARPGISEIELAAEIEYAMRSAGSDYPAVPTWMASGPRGYCQHAMASPRRLEAGDLVHAEFAGVARRYHSVTMGSLTLGSPSRRIRDMEHGAITAFQAGLEAARIGGRIGDVEIAYQRALDDLGLGDCYPMRFGVGLSAAYPPVWENQITIQVECDDVFEPGMAFYIHSSMQSMGERTGMLLGGSFLMTQTGPERLDKAPIELVVID